MSVDYEDETIEEQPCKCGGDRMYQRTKKPNKHGFVHFKIRCVACDKKEKGKFDWHLGCPNWPNCDIGGCGEH